MSGYDSHLLIRKIGTSKNFEGCVKLIPQNKERYISFTKYVKDSKINFRFIDSFRFLPSSFDKLSSYLDSHPIVKEEFKKDGYTSEQIELLKRKGVYPYDFTSSFDSLKVKELPRIEDFYSHLNEEEITEADYLHAQRVWRDFNIQNLGEYCDLYLKQDVLLLANIFEDFRNNCMQAYGLDVAHYYTTPGYSWDAMLKFTDVKLELLTNVDMLLFTEKVCVHQ